ncbi:MAG: M13 family metallopeptidase [Bacteroidales bacterium]|nr:M13 family metallopeptidase [Bacteroidales bacterium]MBQ5539250.1 M13 family metallopeptidase [Bacteroidales bacterium]
MKRNLILISLLLSACTMGDKVQTKSGLDASNMDLTVKPGENFYRYANGKWLDNNPVKPEMSRYMQFDKLQLENTERQKEIIENLAKGSADINTDGGKIAAIYSQYMDSTARNQAGNAPVKPYLSKINNAKDKKALMELFPELQKYGISGLLFDYGVSSDIKEADKNIVELWQGGLSLPSKTYYEKTDSATLDVVNAYKKYITALFSLADYPENTASEKTKAVFDIETKIANISRDKVQLRDVSGNYNKMTYSELKDKFKKIDWDGFFSGLGFPEFEYLSVGQPEVISRIETLLEEEKLEDLKSYFEFKVLNSSANFLDDNFSGAKHEFEKVLSGVQVQKPRWKRAIDVVNSAMGMAIGKLYAEKYFPETSKQAVIDLVKNLQNSLADEIKNSSWMSDSTKTQALDKLSSFYLKIGYPDKWQDYSDLKIDTSKSLLDNMLSASVYYTDYIIKTRVNKPVDKTEWHMTPQTVNAYYNPTTNEITFPAGILQPPFYNPENDEAENYGGIGCVIGHEMTHGFDDQGCQFDKYGNQKNWWTESDKKEFDSRAQVIIDYFNTLEVLPGEFVNGSLTVGENIADNGGIKIAFLALQNVMKQKKLETINGFTPEQRFFLAYAFIWAGNIREQAARLRLQTDPHSPTNMRVNGQLPQLEFWYKAFNITDKDPMYIAPEKRVNIW